MPDFDASELLKLADSFGDASPRLMRSIRPVMERAGVGMKRRMVREASGHRHLPALPGYVEYDVDQRLRSISVEVGFRKEGQGNLAAIAAFGTSKTAPVMDITAPLIAEVPLFMRFAAKAASEVF
jgi:hypothetical protein